MPPILDPLGAYPLAVAHVLRLRPGLGNSARTLVLLFRKSCRHIFTGLPRGKIAATHYVAMHHFHATVGRASPSLSAREVHGKRKLFLGDHMQFSLQTVLMVAQALASISTRPSLYFSPFGSFGWFASRQKTIRHCRRQLHPAGIRSVRPCDRNAHQCSASRYQASLCALDRPFLEGRGSGGLYFHEATVWTSFAHGFYRP